MSDETENKKDEAAESGPQGLVGGERLAEARREQQISVLEIAKELHLDEPKVRALERNEFDTIGAPVFAKGHLKKYAQLVGVDEADVLKDYYELTRSATMPPVVSGRPRPRREMSPGPWIAVIVVIIIAATAFWWLTSRPVTMSESESESEPEPESESLPEEPAPQQQQAESPVEVDDTAAPAADDVPALPADDSVTDTPAPAVDDGDLHLLVTFRGECWTEITDASGARLFFGLGREGRTVELSGDPPFNVLFGNADNVSLRVNGSEYAISASERRGRTARLTLSGT